MMDENLGNRELVNHRPSVVSNQSSRSGVVNRDGSWIYNVWRPSTYINAVSNKRRSRASSTSTDQCWLGPDGAHEKESAAGYIKNVRNKWRWTTLVTVMVVRAKGLPQTTDESSVCCKIRLGAESYKTHSVPRSQHEPEWREQFELHIYRDHLLKLAVWDKGKQKNFMGSCVVDLTTLEKERTHELMRELDDGFGEIHLCVTICTVRDSTPSTTEGVEDNNIYQKKKYDWFNIPEVLHGDLKMVGELHVRVITARGLPSKPNAYCTLELHNQRVQTHSCRASEGPAWNKRYVFDVYDVTSTLNLKLNNSSFRSSFGNDNLGEVSIPLFRVVNEELRWYGLKDTSKRHSAKGNHPRVLLQMSLVYNPTKAALKLFTPKEVIYHEKEKKLDLNVVYKNTVFIQDLFDAMHLVNDYYMQLFEWENLEVSVVSLVGWLMFWLFFQPWMVPLGLLVPFIFHLVWGRNLGEKTLETSYRNFDDELMNTSDRHKQNLPGKVQSLPKIAMGIIANIELVVSLAERMYNLATFKVPFLSYVAIIILLVSSFVFYFIPFNYLMMGLGVYKFSRKYLNPKRRLNNDLVDFITRIPDNEMWKDWKELSVPEPVQSSHDKLTRSYSGHSNVTDMSSRHS